jgi:heme/copper-type cytochrome/quinol oxidase subunit 2
MTWTAESGLAPLVRLFYDQQQIKTFAQELLIVVNTSYYFSLIVIVAFALATVYSFVKGKSSADNAEPHFSSTTKRALTTCFHTFLVFIAFFYFLLRNDEGNQALMQTT